MKLKHSNLGKRLEGDAKGEAKTFKPLVLTRQNKKKKIRQQQAGLARTPSLFNYPTYIFQSELVQQLPITFSINGLAYVASVIQQFKMQITISKSPR